MEHPHTSPSQLMSLPLALLTSLSLGACAVPTRGSLAASSIVGSASKTTAYAAPVSDAYDRDAIASLLGSLSYAGNDVSISLDEVYIEVTGGRVIIWHDYEIPSFEDVPEVMQRESRRCLALSVALYGANIVDVNGGSSPFESITWALADGHGNNYLAIVDGQGIARTGTRSFDLYPQADGFVLSETLYVSILRRESGIPPRSGVTPLDINGNPIECTGWLAVPDYYWTSGLPETSEDSSGSGYWYESEVEIAAPITWYPEFTQQEEQGSEDEPGVVIVDPENPDYVDPDDSGYTDPENPGSEDSGELVDPGSTDPGVEPVDPGPSEGGNTSEEPITHDDGDAASYEDADAGL